MLNFHITVFSFFSILCFKGNFDVSEVSGNKIDVSWDAAPLGQAGVKRLRLVAQPINETLPVAEATVDAAVGKGTITGSLKPLTTYVISVEDTGNSGFVYTIGDTTTGLYGT